MMELFPLLVDVNGRLQSDNVARVPKEWYSKQMANGTADAALGPEIRDGGDASASSGEFISAVWIALKMPRIILFHRE